VREARVPARQSVTVWIRAAFAQGTIPVGSEGITRTQPAVSISFQHRALGRIENSEGGCRP